MNIRFYNARILQMNGSVEVIEGELWVKDNKIAYIGAGKASNEKWDKEIDCEKNLLMPGFKDVHTHSGMTAFRSLADDLNLQEWLNDMIFPREAVMSGEDVYWMTKLAILEYLTTGVTLIADMYLTPETIHDACAEMGMRCELISGLNKFGPTLEVMENRFIELNKKSDLVGFKMGLHAEYTCDRELLEKASELIHKYKAPVYVHMSETETEVKECFDRYGKSPVALFDELGLWDFGGSIYHGVWCDDADMEILKKRNISVISNPGSNTKLASGIAPISKYLEKGIIVGLGTDGPSSNNCLDMFREMFLVTGLAKLKERDPKAVAADEVLKMACVNGALSLDHEDCSCLEEGKLADIIMIDLRQPNMQPILNIPKNIVYSGSKINIKMTMIDGKILYMNGEFIGVDADEIYRKCEEITERLKDI
ncbi:5-methylthioadenosine/S-adenosylhomocysteine deaminase [Lachnospiraceae bacterium XPB1003]|nr:5-methylthioadenosine/S-adenosylhomocysteine deaminase [Lachnospiraceae bacterium XPB1003]